MIQRVDGERIEDMVRAKREEILSIAARHGATNVRLFGSVARGESGPDSDVDFLVDVGPETTPWFPGGLIVDLEDLLGRRVDVVTSLARVHHIIREQIVADLVAL